MKNLITIQNVNTNQNVNTWSIFCVFSNTEFYKFNSFNLTECIFNTKSLNNIEEDATIRLLECNFDHVFNISSK
jgi:hypothetical protein